VASGATAPGPALEGPRASGLRLSTNRKKLMNNEKTKYMFQVAKVDLV
jgi:hypothetical protein